MTASSSFSPAVDFEVLLFGALKDAAHSNHIHIQVEPDSTDNSTDNRSVHITVAGLLAAAAQQYPTLEKYLPHLRVAVNCEYSGLDQTIRSGDEIALIPPVAGG